MPVLICLRQKLWTRTYSIGDQVPTCPVFTRAKIRSRFGILIHFVSQYSWYSHQKIGIRTVGLGNKRTSGDHPNYSIVKIGWNTEKSPGDLNRLVVTQTLVRNHWLTLVWKTQKGITIIMIIWFVCVCYHNTAKNNTV